MALHLRITPISSRYSCKVVSWYSLSISLNTTREAQILWRVNSLINVRALSDHPERCQNKFNYMVRRDYKDVIGDSKCWNRG
jgi:hypothetical protein